MPVPSSTKPLRFAVRAAAEGRALPSSSGERVILRRMALRGLLVASTETSRVVERRAPARRVRSGTVMASVSSSAMIQAATPPVAGSATAPSRWVPGMQPALWATRCSHCVSSSPYRACSTVGAMRWTRMLRALVCGPGVMWTCAGGMR